MTEREIENAWHWLVHHVVGFAFRLTEGDPRDLDDKTGLAIAHQVQACHDAYERERGSFWIFFASMLLRRQEGSKVSLYDVESPTPEEWLQFVKLALEPLVLSHFCDWCVRSNLQCPGVGFNLVLKPVMLMRMPDFFPVGSFGPIHFAPIKYTQGGKFMYMDAAKPVHDPGSN